MIAIVEGVAFAGAMLITAALGIPVALASTRPHLWRRPAPRDRGPTRTAAPHRVQFKPLDLGPDPVKWPSERPWETQSTIRAPVWPSRTWNDEHFGQHWKQSGFEVQDRGFHAMAARRASASDETPTAPPRVAQQQQQPRVAREALAQATPARQRAQATGGLRRTPPPRKGQTPGRTAVQQPQAPAPAPPLAPRPPDEAEVEHLIATVGLAGTVQAIMARTGWEFREAAQYLARVRRDR